MELRRGKNQFGRLKLVMLRSDPTFTTILSCLLIRPENNDAEAKELLWGQKLKYELKLRTVYRKDRLNF